ncbi:MFS transporter [Bailinhaonella thermotolerans]|uniref:MFS transporter n=1 Tax=Bailinhaonella thermotolerans TaxID=1070861 RepID=A0A3A4AYE7_9ACTN|nr:MFS transporter [Bailinhaonella thermotolerans]RJL35367.1 MFS transporter [Bailinhaonella thermotolerans]
MTATASPPGGTSAELRRERRAWYLYDWANSAFYTTVITVFFGPYLTGIAEAAAEARGGLILGIRPSAYFTYVIGAAAAAQIVVMPIAGALADHTGRKKELLGAFAYLGAFATLAMFFVTGDAYLLGGALLVVATVGFAAAQVISHSFLNDLAGPDERDTVSARGWGVGYLGGGLLLLANLLVFTFHASLGLDAAMAVRLALASAGLWWAGFTLIPMLRLTNRGHVVRSESVGRAVSGSFRQLGRTIAGLRLYPLTLVFLVAYLLYNDGVQTVINFSSVFATEGLGLSQDTLAAAILMVQFVAFGGALLLGALARRHGAKRVVLVSLVGWAGVVAAAYFLQAGAAWQFFAMGFVIAIVMGGTQALSRSMFSQVIPRGREAEYFSLYEISDKGATFLGSLVVGTVLQVTDSYRLAILSLLVFFALGFVILAALDLPKAIRAAGNDVPGRL